MANHELFPNGLAIICRLIHQDRRARTAFFLADRLAPIVRRLKKAHIFTDRRANLYRSFLQGFNRAGLTCTIPIQVVGLEMLKAVWNEHGSVLLISVHLTMNRLVHNVLLPLNRPYSVIAGPSFRNPMGEILGDPTLATPPIIASGPKALLIALKRIQTGSALMSDIDFQHKKSGKKGLSTHLFQLAQKVHKPLVFFASRLLPNGVTYLEFHTPTHLSPIPQSDLQPYLIAFRHFMTPFTQGRLSDYPFTPIK